MRNEVFNADAETDAAAARVAQKGGDVEAFRRAAAEASTPQQVQAVEAKH